MRALIISMFLFIVSPAFAQTCGIANCHGLDVTCGMNAPDMCTEVYMMGDFCRQYVKCEEVQGDCILVKDPKFDECKSCVVACKKEDDAEKIFQCEDDCRQKLSEANKE